MPNTPPTAVAVQNLVESTGTRSFASVTTQASDYVVVSIQIENAAASDTFVPSGTGVTFPGTANVDSNNGNASNGRAIIWVGQETGGGGTRTITITSNNVKNYYSRLTVVRGSLGPGTGKGSASTAQTVSVTRQADNSMMFMGVTDWSTGPVGTPTWTPGGITVVSQQGTAATYIFGRWDDSGTAATANHGISTPTYTTPAIAVQEMLGTPSGGTAQLLTPQAMPGLTWKRWFSHRLQVPNANNPVGTTQSGDASLTSTATITPTAAVSANGDASLTSTATITPTAAVIANGDASLTATAAISATATVTPAGSTAALTVTATISPTATLTTTASASLTSTATITAAAATQANASVSLTATATITATATVTRAASASPAITATITPTGAVTANAQAALTATASISATATVGAAPILAQASLTATATITPTATAIPNAAAAPTTTATITAAGTVTRPASAAQLSVATITAAGAVQANASVSSSITAAIAVTAEVIGPFTVGVLTAQSSAPSLTAQSSASSLTAQSSAPSSVAASTPTASFTATSARGGPT